jgi:ubiquinone/menaquinone biosynthesis C-methylase UbiE
MGFYAEYVIPPCIACVMRDKRLEKYRRAVVPAAEGRVLEIGVGSGLNFQFYAKDKVQRIFALEPSAGLRKRAARRAAETSIPVDFVGLDGADIPLGAGDVDTVVTTWTLCSIAEVATALSEMRRVLKPAGRLLFVEHGAAGDAGVRLWQDRLDPVWTRLAGGCHMNRPIDTLIADAGFEFLRLDTEYAPGPRVLTFLYSGAARPR